MSPVDPLPDESPTAGLTPDDYRCWSADLSYADGFAMLAAAVMAGYVAIALLVARRFAPGALR